MAANFDLSALSLAAVCPGNEILYDDLGFPSVMVKIPKMTYAQLGMGESMAAHPAFIVNGTEVDAIYISKYQNIVKDGRAYSLPGQDPRADITFNAACAACEAKGDGWHCMTRMEWGALVRWCQVNGAMPLGNNHFGKHKTETVYKAIPTARSLDYPDRIARVASGTGPLTWFHDQMPNGIADLCGNVGEWSGGIRTVYGELQILANNNGADSGNSQGTASSKWMAINASTGALITPDGFGTTTGSVKMDWINSKLTYSTTITTARGHYGCTFANITCDSTIGDNTKFLLQSLGLLMYGSSNELFSSHYNDFNNAEAEKFFYSGGHYYNSADGFASFRGNGTRSFSSMYVGFRAAYVKLPSA